MNGIKHIGIVRSKYCNGQHKWKNMNNKWTLPWSEEDFFHLFKWSILTDEQSFAKLRKYGIDYILREHIIDE